MKNTLVIDFDSKFANTLGRLLGSRGRPVQVASTAMEALRLLRESPFKSILLDSRTPFRAARAILREIYARTPPRIYLMNSIPAPSMVPELRCEERIEIVQANAESVVSLLHRTPDSEVALIAGPGIPANLKRALWEEGYPAVVTHDVDIAARLHFGGTHPVVFLEACIPGLTEPENYAVLHTLTARSLAVLAYAQPASDLRCVSKPQKIADIFQLLLDLREDSTDSMQERPVA